MPEILPFVGPALGIAGLFQQNDAQNSRDQAIGDANALQRQALAWQQSLHSQFSEPALRALMGIAQGYDPVGESRASTQHAGVLTEEALGRALRGFDVRTRAGGGIPGNSSLHGAQQAAVMRPIAQQFAGIVADAEGNASAKKAQMWQAVLGQAPAGQLGQSYFQAADALGRSAQNMPGGDFGGSSRLLGDILGGLFKGGAPGGAPDPYGTRTDREMDFGRNLANLDFSWLNGR